MTDGQIQGLSTCDPLDGSISALFGDPANEGRGIGRALLALACDTVRFARFDTPTLNTEPATRLPAEWMGRNRTECQGRDRVPTAITGHPSRGSRPVRL